MDSNERRHPVFGKFQRKFERDNPPRGGDTVRLYHVTTLAAAAEIERYGFRDGEGWDPPRGDQELIEALGLPIEPIQPPGVWLSYTPLSPAEDLPPGRAYPALFAVDIPRSVAAAYEWDIPGVEDPEMFCIPAETLNALATPERLRFV